MSLGINVAREAQLAAAALDHVLSADMLVGFDHQNQPLSFEFGDRLLEDIFRMCPVFLRPMSVPTDPRQVDFISSILHDVLRRLARDLIPQANSEKIQWKNFVARFEAILKFVQPDMSLGMGSPVFVYPHLTEQILDLLMMANLMARERFKEHQHQILLRRLRGQLAEYRFPNRSADIFTHFSRFEDITFWDYLRHCLAGAIGPDAFGGGFPVQLAERGIFHFLNVMSAIRLSDVILDRFGLYLFVEEQDHSEVVFRQLKDILRIPMDP